MKKVVIFLVAIVLLLGASYGLFKTSQKDNGRIDIYHAMNPDNKIEVLQTTPGFTSSAPESMMSPEWKDEPGQGATFTFTPDFFWKDGEIVFKAVGDGRLDVNLLGAYRPINGTDELQQINVEYKDVAVNDEVKIEGPVTAWHNDPQFFSIPTTNDETYTLKFKYRAPLSFGAKKSEAPQEEVVEEIQVEEEYTEEPQGEEYSEEQQPEEEIVEEEVVEEEQPAEEGGEEEQPAEEEQPSEEEQAE